VAPPARGTGMESGLGGHGDAQQQPAARGMDSGMENAGKDEAQVPASASNDGAPRASIANDEQAAASVKSVSIGDDPRVRRSNNFHISATFLLYNRGKNPSVPLRDTVLSIPGGLSVTPDFLFFEPDPRFRESSKQKETDKHHWMVKTKLYKNMPKSKRPSLTLKIYVDMIDILEAGAVTMPAADNTTGMECIGSANFFLQINLHPRKRYKTGLESQLLLFKLGSKDVLYEVTKQLIEQITAFENAHSPRSLESERENTGTTNIPHESPSVEVLLGISDEVEFKDTSGHAPPISALHRRTGLSDIGGFDIKGMIEEHDENTYSGILTPETAEQLGSMLPLSVRYSPWLLAYSPRKHGVSLQSLYRNLADKGPSLVVVRDSNGQIFGGFASDTWAPTNKYYGTGESFVFSLAGDDVKVYPWAARNNFIQYGDDKMIAMGGGGDSALVIDGSFLRGSSQKCNTFLNDRLSSEDDFVVQDIEFWTFNEEYMGS